MLTKNVRVKVGSVIKCLYPKNGNRNILVTQQGRVEKVGRNWVTIEREDGSYRTLSGLKIVSPVVS